MRGNRLKGSPEAVMPHRPDIVSCYGCHPIEVVINRAIGIGARHDAPRAAVPMQCQRLVYPPLQEIRPHGPHVVARGSCDFVEVVAIGVGVRAWYDTPGVTVPMQCECLVYKHGLVVVPSYRPHVIGRYGVHGAEIVAIIAHIRAWHDAPCAAVPMLYQRGTGRTFTI